MKLFTHEQLATLPLCETELNRLRKALPQKRFTAKTAIRAFVRQRGSTPDVARAYQAAVNAKLLPDTKLIWKIARIAFREQPETSGLRVWATKLGPDNWKQASNAAYDIAYAAYAAAYAAHDIAYDAAYAAYVAAYAAAYADDDAAYAAKAAAAAAAAARKRVEAEIIKLIINEVTPHPRKASNK